jgi:hypothetical protein
MLLPQPKTITKSVKATAAGGSKTIFLQEGITAFIGVCVRLLHVM